MIENDHEWSSKNAECGGIAVRPPCCGNRIIVKLYWEIAPLACENFALLCSHGSTVLEGKMKPAPIGESGKPLSYRGSIVHRVIPKFVLQGGDFVFGNGSGGESALGKKTFKDERAGLSLKHSKRGILSMGNSGKNSNTSQFFLTFDAAPQCDGKHVVFGEMISGFEVLDYMEQYGTKDGPPSVPITITDCGIFSPLMTAGAGYWYDQPDEEAYSGVSPVFMVRPRVAVVGPSRSVLERFQKAMGTHATIVQSLSADEFETNEAIQTRIQELLSSFSIDVVVVAPACKDELQSTRLPSAWTEIDSSIAIDQVVMEAKPVDALSAIWRQSWMSKRDAWQLDGASS
jgi:cyclophilin family peptidyl-prolyl cis-trans isomerase